MGKTKRVTRRSNFNVSSKHRNVTGNDAALVEDRFLFRQIFFFLIDYLEPVPIPVSQACNIPL